MSKDNVIHVDFAKRKIIKPKKIEEPLRTPNKVDGAKYKTPTYLVITAGKVDKNGRKFSQEALASMCETPRTPHEHDWATFLAAHEGRIQRPSDHDFDWEEFMRAQQGLPPKHPHGPLIEYVKEGCFPGGVGVLFIAIAVLFILTFMYSI